MRFLSFLLTFAVAALLLPASSFAYEKKTPVTDDAIHDQVIRKLADDAEVKGAALDVEVHNGEVTLKGKVPSDKARSKAEKLAKKVHGVTSVQNQLTIKE